MTRSGRRRQVRLRDVISPVLRPALWSAILGATAAIAFAAPAYADPTLPHTIPDTGTRPQVAGQLTLPGSVPAGPGTDPTTAPSALNGPLATQVLALENEVAVLGDQLLQLKQGSWAASLASSVAGKWVRVSLVSRWVCDACELVMQGWRWGSIRGLRFVAMAV
jgi:hypothetical protein